MKAEQHFDTILAFAVFLIVAAMFWCKGDSQFTQGLVTGAMLSLSTRLGTGNANKIYDTSGNDPDKTQSEAKG